jgi:hypothetical protein
MSNENEGSPSSGPLQGTAEQYRFQQFFFSNDLLHERRLIRVLFDTGTKNFFTNFFGNVSAVEVPQHGGRSSYKDVCGYQPQ